MILEQRQAMDTGKAGVFGWNGNQNTVVILQTTFLS